MDWTTITISGGWKKLEIKSKNSPKNNIFLMFVINVRESTLGGIEVVGRIDSGQIASGQHVKVQFSNEKLIVGKVEKVDKKRRTCLYLPGAMKYQVESGDILSN